MARVLIPLPSEGFDPTEAAVPWRLLAARGHQVQFATPDGQVALADLRMLNGAGLGPLRSLLIADANGRSAYEAMAQAPAFNQPCAYTDIDEQAFDALLLPGGHAPGMIEYLESEVLQALVAHAFEKNLPVGAICHGVLLAARAKDAQGRSVLYGRKTTALTQRQELIAWALTVVWAGDYYRTYPTTVEAEVRAALAAPQDFLPGPLPLRRDSPQHLDRGFAVRDSQYVSARWPGDAHRFARSFARLLEA